MKATIYYADVNALIDEQLYMHYYEQMPLYRKEKIDRFRSSKDKRLSLGVGALLQIACKDCEIVEPLKIQKNENGKPFFEAYPDFHFNLSHSEDKVICIVFNKPVGCDIEYHRKNNLKIANRFFFKDEFNLIKMQESEEEQRKMFYRFWTLKESFMKVTGKGFSLPLDEFEIILNQPISIKQTVSPKEYSFFEYEMDPRFSCSCCVEGKETTKPIMKEIVLKK